LLLTAVALLVLIGAAALALGLAVFGDDDEPTPTPTQAPIAALDLAAPLGWDGVARGSLLHLVVEPARPGENAFAVRVTDSEGARQAQPAETMVELALTSFAPGPSPDLIAAEADGAGGFATAPVALTEEGWWEVEVRLRRPDEAEVRQPFYLILPDPNAYGEGAVPLPATDATAEAVYEQGRATFTGLHRVRYREQMATGAGNVALAEYAVSDGTDGRPAARSAETFNSAYVQVGGQIWVRTQDGQWLAGNPPPFVYPTDWDREWEGATGFALGPEQEVGGEVCRVVTFFVPGETLAAAWYAVWFGTETGNVHRVAMISRSHYMITDYRDFDVPFVIEPPLTDGATPATA
jgi:hypothetical protein